MTDPFISYAQNFEDVVLWRVLGGVRHGLYIDVGAADPVVDSVTLAFSQRGWSGINIEPVPEFAQRLRTARPSDLCFEVAVGAAPGVAELQVFSGTGWSTLDSAAAQTLSEREEHEFTTVEVPVRTLDSVLEEADVEDRDIHFLKIDVEGLEEQVLAGTDLSRWKPWIVVVEATEPASTVTTHGRWEHHLTSAGYECCLFDGLNRFYVSPHHAELRDDLSYPAGLFDQPYETAYDHNVREQRRGEEHHLLAQFHQLEGELRHARAEAHAAASRLQHAVTFGNDMRTQAVAHRQTNLELAAAMRDLRAELGEARARVERLEFDLHDAQQHVQLIHQTVSWRVTQPLRAIRRGRRDAARPDPVFEGGPAVEVSTDAEEIDPRSLMSPTTRRQLEAYSLRLDQAAALLDGESIATVPPTDPPLERFERALSSSSETVDRRAWLALVASAGRYPEPNDMLTAARLLRRGGPAHLLAHVESRFEIALRAGTASELGLDIRRGQALVDIGHTAAYDLLTGIQRVVREVASRWFATHQAVAVQWEFEHEALTALSQSEVERFAAWRTNSHASGSELQRRTVQSNTAGTIVPWDCLLLVPELAAEPARSTPYRAAAEAGVLRRLSLIGYDLIPMTAAETVTEGMSGVFALYLAMVKHAHRVSAISETTAAELSAFVSALVGQGIEGPQIAAHSLPPGTPHIDPESSTAFARRLGIGRDPLVLVVGSHEPRKNHIVVLEAADVLWNQGLAFDLMFIGGSSWRSGVFDDEARRLTQVGRPLHIVKRATEDELWAAYDLASFTVFPSLVEGYGLPIAESMACGTPVITSKFGSMAEVGRGGGAILVDPRDPDAVADAMRSLLTHPAELERLTAEAAKRDWKSWDQYADEVWHFFVD